MADKTSGAHLEDLVRAVDRLGSLLEHRIAPALERIAASLSMGPAHQPEAGMASERSRAVTALREGLGLANLESAESLVAEFAATFPDAPELEEVRAEIEVRRGDRLASLRRRVEMGLAAGEPEEVLAARDELAVHLDEEGLGDLDASVLGWLVGLIQSRMRSGTVGLDVALWAGEVVSRYGTSREGQALRESLPVLRRCAGLCARCGAPYRGIEASCPKCLQSASALTAPADVHPHAHSSEVDPSATGPGDEPDELLEEAEPEHEGGFNGFLGHGPQIGPG
jgi:hypothetical protein